MMRSYFDGTHLIRRLGPDTWKLEAAPADSSGKQIGPYEPIKGRELWAETSWFVRRCEAAEKDPQS